LIQKKLSLQSESAFFATMMVKQVLMSIVTLVSFVMAQYEDFSRVTSIGGGLISTGYYSSEE
jgi:hypothetical protein